jgi:hypothetical protein
MIKADWLNDPFRLTGHHGLWQATVVQKLSVRCLRHTFLETTSGLLLVAFICA